MVPEKIKQMVESFDAELAELAVSVIKEMEPKETWKDILKNCMFFKAQEDMDGVIYIYRVPVYRGASGTSGYGGHTGTAGWAGTTCTTGSVYTTGTTGNIFVGAVADNTSTTGNVSYPVAKPVMTTAEAIKEIEKYYKNQHNE